MKVLFNNFVLKYQNNKKDIHLAIEKVFKNGWFILGPELEHFEKNLAAYLGVNYAIGVNSGTDAIFLALKALNIGNGDEVITVANTATPTISAIRMTGAVPIFVDIDPNDFNINIALIEDKISKKTKAILPVHLYGRPSNMTKILSLAKKYDLYVVEDVAQAFGAKYKNKKVGTFSDIACFSFYPTKNLGAFGDAGAIVTKNKDLATKIKALRNYGEESKFYNIYEGYNSRLDEIQAAFLNTDLKKVDKWNKRRREIADMYLVGLKNLPIILPPKNDQIFQAAWHLFVIRCKNREKLRDFLNKHGVQTGVHYPKPIFQQPAYNFLKVKSQFLPETIKTMQEIVSLPIYPELKNNEINYVIKVVRNFFSNN